MKPLLLYLLQVIVCSGLLYGYYHLLLRNKKFHQYNRYYLLAAAIVSMLVPFLNIPIYFSAGETAPVWIQTLDGLSANSYSFFAGKPKQDASSLFTRDNILLCLYVLVSSYVLYRLVVAIIRIRKITGKYPVEKMDGINFVNTEEAGTPFSFFHWLFWNKKVQLNSPDGQQIFRHELYHIRQRHTLDLLFMEMLTIVFWINPFFHLIKKELTAIHEFLADQFAVKENERWNYAELLLMHLMGSPNLRFTHPFFHNQLKRRIAMITSSNKPKYQYLRKVLVLPLLALVALLFAFTYKQKKEVTGKEATGTEVLLPSGNLYEMRPADTPREKRKTEAYFLKADKIIVQGQKAGSTQETVKPDLIILDSKQYTRKDLEEKYGMNFVLEGMEAYITPANDPEAINKYGPPAKNGVIEIKKAIIRHDLELVVERPVTAGSIITSKAGDPLVVIDEEVQVKTSATLALEKIAPEEIKEISVLKDKTAIEKYGDRGTNGVVEITTKKKGALLLKEEGKRIVEVPLTVVNGPEKNDLTEVTVVGYPVKRAGSPSFNEDFNEDVEVALPGKLNANNKPGLKEKVIAVEEYPKKSPVITTDTEKLPAIYPNPAGNTVNIPYSSQSEGTGEVRVQDMLGNVHLATKTTLAKGMNNLNVNVASLATGTYVITVTDANKKQARVYKMVKE